MTMSGLEDLPDGQTVRCEVNRGQCNGSSARLFSNRCWSSSLANVKNMNNRVHKTKDDTFVRISLKCVR